MKLPKTKTDIDFTELEWGVELDGDAHEGNCIVVCEDEESARCMAAMTATGKLRCRNVYYGAWAEA